MMRRLITVAALLLTAGNVPNRISTSTVHAASVPCFAPLTLLLRPGRVPGGVGLQNQLVTYRQIR